MPSHYLEQCWLVVNSVCGNKLQLNLNQDTNISFGEMHYKMSSPKCIPLVLLTHLGRETHRCVSKIIIIGSDNGLSPDRRQAIIWINAGILLIGPSEITFSKILIEIHNFLQENAFQNVVWKMAAILSRPQCVEFGSRHKHFRWINVFQNVVS